MRTPEEIRRYIKALHVIATKPCDCQANGHGDECEAGKTVLIGVIQALRWVMHDDCDCEKCRVYNDAVKEIEQQVREFLAGPGVG